MLRQRTKIEIEWFWALMQEHYPNHFSLNYWWQRYSPDLGSFWNFLNRFRVPSELVSFGLRRFGF